ncbi:MAG TPA: helix-turn-helix domain-containing protein [Nitriliruptorales bacterium]
MAKRATTTTTTSEPTSPSGGARLERLVDDLGSRIIEVLAAPGGLDIAIGHPVIHDPAEPLVLDEGDLLLAVGVAAEDPAAAELVFQAGKEGASAVFVKVRQLAPERLLKTAEEAGVALFGVTPEMTWTQLHTLIRTAMASAGHSPEAHANGGVALGDLFGLANAVAAMVGGAVTIEDPQSRVLAYSSLDTPIDEPRRRTILGRRVPDEWVAALNDAGIFRELWGSEDVVHIEGLGAPGELRPRIATAVRAGDEIVGSIWVSEGDSPLDEAAEEALRQAAKIAALHLVRSRYGEDVERRMRGDLLRRVLDGRGPLSHLADRLGLSPDAPFVVAAFELQSHEDAEIALQRERALELVALYCEAYRRRAVQVPIGRTIYALVPLDRTQSMEGVHRLARDVLQRSGDVLSVEVLVGIGSIVPSLRDVPRSRGEADQVLRVLGGGRSEQVATIDDVRAQVLLLQLRDHVSNRPELLNGKLNILFEHDQDNAGAYIETLRAYLDHFGDVPSAAKSLDVHPNTFRYRVRRLCEVADLSLEDPDERLAVELQLRLGPLASG